MSQTINIKDIPGYYPKVQYTTVNDDYSFIAQHNYDACPVEVVVRGWYDESMMKACDSMVAYWKVKQLH